jgi:hypothetical protein
MNKIKISIGQKFNMLTVLEELPVGPNGRVLRCQCDCGNIKQVLLPHLMRSLIKSCGCYKRTLATKHGMWESREYSSWENMIQRCTNPKARKYYLYGGRGITVCNRWLESFKAFYEDMGPRPENTSLDRLDNDKGYYKDNCRWSNPREQLVNVRFFNQIVKHDVIVKTVDQWINDLNVDRNIFKSRVLRGLGFKEALFCTMDVITLNVVNKQQVIYRLPYFLSLTGFEKEKVMELLDCDHEEPYHELILRYLTGFEGWPVKYA